MIGFAQLSFWFGHAHGNCNAARQHPHAELVCVWDEDPDRGQAAAERHGVAFVADLDEVLAREDVDAVGICSPTHLHAEHVVRAAEAGKHCVVEKPFTRTVAQADLAISAAEKHNIHVMPLYTLRFSPANEKMKEIVDAKRAVQALISLPSTPIGGVFVAVCERVPRPRPNPVGRTKRLQSAWSSTAPRGRELVLGRDSGREPGIHDFVSGTSQMAAPRPSPLTSFTLSVHSRRRQRKSQPSYPVQNRLRQRPRSRDFAIRNVT